MSGSKYVCLKMGIEGDSLFQCPILQELTYDVQVCHRFARFSHDQGNAVASCSSVLFARDLKSLLNRFV